MDSEYTLYKTFNALLHQAAKLGSIRLKGSLSVKSDQQASAILLHVLRRKMASAIFRAHLNCLQTLRGFVGNSGHARTEQRRADARRRFFPGGDPSASTAQYRNTHRMMDDENFM